MLDIYLHQRVEKNHMVGIRLEGGSALIYFYEREGALVPVEVRLSSAPIEDFLVQPLKEFVQNSPNFSSYPRISSHQLRKISMSEVTTKLRSMISEVKQGETASGAVNPNIIFRTGESNFGYRNVRDLQAAIARLNAASIYVKELHTGNTKPLILIAQELSVPVTRARALIAGARRDGFLTSDAPGAVGGSLTERALVLATFLKINNGGNNEHS